MKILSLGSRSSLAQVERIEKGFISLGHELVESEPDLIFCNDAGFHSRGIELKKKYTNAKLVLNVLDIPTHLYNVGEIINELRLNFYFCDAVTTISETIRNQMFHIFPELQKKGINTIYQPIKNVKPLNLERNNKLLSVGRVNDNNKCFSLAIELAAISGLVLDVIGPEDPTNFVKQEYRKFVNYLGLISDKKLNIEYNEHRAVLITSKVEGLCLPLLEAFATKTPVVCCDQMATAKEFCHPKFICRTNLYDMLNKLQYVTNQNNDLNEILIEYSEKYIKQFSPESVASNIIKVCQLHLG